MRLADEFTRWQCYGGDFSILDHFKRINDELGHLVGDTVLRVMAERVQKTVRVQDLFGRFGGEEFALLLPCTPFEDAMIVAEKVRRAIGETPIDVQGARVLVTARVGVAYVQRDVT